MADGYVGPERRAESKEMIEAAAEQAREKIDEAADEARAKVKQDEQDRRLRKIASGVLLLLTFAVAVITAIGTFVQNKDAENADKDIREGQYVACIVNGNAFREDVRDEFVDLKKRGIRPVFQNFIGLAPPGTKDPGLTILQDAVDRLDRRAETIGSRIPDIDCEARYPPIHGQEFPTIEEVLAREEEKP